VKRARGGVVWTDAMKRVVLASAPLSLAALALAACGGGAEPEAPGRAPAPAASGHRLPEEKRLADLRQLTLEGENAEAYWAFGGGELVFRARTGDADCDRIFRMPLAGFLPGDPPRPGVPPRVPVSSGDGATTCA
jgi:hypothetical protein